MPIFRHFKGQLRTYSRTQGLSYFCKGKSNILRMHEFVKTRVIIDIGQLFFSCAHKKIMLVRLFTEVLLQWNMRNRIVIGQNETGVMKNEE